MSIKIKLKHSAVNGKAPLPSDLDSGELALNTNAASPAAYIKDSTGSIVKLAGAGAIGGTDATTTKKGIVRLADAAAITAGTAGLVVDAAQLKAENLWDRAGTSLAPHTAGDVVNFSAGTAALPGLTPVGDADSGLFSSGADQIAVATNGTGRLFVDASGNIGVGTATPATTLDVNGDVTITDKIIHSGDTNTAIRFPATDTVSIETSGGERVRITSSGSLLVGTSSLFSGTPPGANLQIESSNQFGPQLKMRGLHDDPNPVFAVFDRARGSKIVQSDDSILQLDCRGFDGADYRAAARIRAEVDGTPGVNDMPGRLTFFTTPAGTTNPIERMRIKSSGVVNITATTVYADNTAALAGGLVAGDIYRKADGTLMITF